MHVILKPRQQDDPASYPDWAGLGWFRNIRGMRRDVERHYHDMPEIWLWHEGSASGVLDGTDVDLAPGTMVFVPPKCLHSYTAHGTHSNTGISPKRISTMRHGHLHTEETGEAPRPEEPVIVAAPENNTPEHPVELPRGTFLKNACRGKFQSGEIVWDKVCEGWTALLLRTGGIAGQAGEREVVLDEGDLIILRANSALRLHATGDSDIAFAIGWPQL